jgi:branched-chain amino acid transport system permease protein
VSDTGAGAGPAHRQVGKARRGPARLLRWVRPALIALALLTPPLYLDASWLRVGQYVMIGAVGAIGLTLLTGQAGQLSLAHPFFLFAGGASYCVISSDHVPGKVGLGLPPLLGLCGAIMIPAALGLAFAPVAGRVRGVYLGVATLSLVYVGLYLGQRYTSISGGTASGRGPAAFTVFGFSFGRNDPQLTIAGVPLGRNERLWYLFLVFTVIGYFLAQGAVRGRPGRAWRAVRDNEHAAAALGVPVPRVRTQAFVVSSGYAGLAGVMTVLWYDLLKPDESEFVGTYSISVAIAFLAMVLIGGLGSVGGAIAGAALVNGLPGALNLSLGGAPLFGSGSTAITPVVFTAFIYGAAIIAVVLFEPGGLAALGRRVSAPVRRAPFGHLFFPSKGS